jgi:hypothetical protein
LITGFTLHRYAGELPPTLVAVNGKLKRKRRIAFRSAVPVTQKTQGQVVHFQEGAHLVDVIVECLAAEISNLVEKPILRLKTIQ